MGWSMKIKRSGNRLLPKRNKKSRSTYRRLSGPKQDNTTLRFQVHIHPHPVKARASLVAIQVPVTHDDRLVKKEFLEILLHS